MSKTVKREVIGAQVYLSVNGKLEHQPKGTIVTIDEETAKTMASSLREVGEGKEVITDGAAANLDAATAAFKEEAEKAKGELAQANDKINQLQLEAAKNSDLFNQLKLDSENAAKLAKEQIEKLTGELAQANADLEAAKADKKSK